MSLRPSAMVSYTFRPHLVGAPFCRTPWPHLMVCTFRPHPSPYLDPLTRATKNSCDRFVAAAR